MGCLLEITEGGTKAWTLKCGPRRIWLEDGDRVRLLAQALLPGGMTIGWGDTEGTISPTCYSPSHHGI